MTSHVSERKIANALIEEAHSTGTSSRLVGQNSVGANRVMHSHTVKLILGR